MTVAIVVYKGLIPVVGRILTLDGCPLEKMSTECSAFGIELIRGYIYTVGNDKDIPLYSYKCPQNKFANVDKRHK